MIWIFIWNWNISSISLTLECLFLHILFLNRSVYLTLPRKKSFKKELIVVLFKDFTDWGICNKKIFLFPENSNGSQREDLLSELKVMKELLSHKHVVQLLACVTKSGEKSSLYYCNNFNPLTPKISLVILLTVCHTVLVTLVWRTWYWINL